MDKKTIRSIYYLLTGLFWFSTALLVSLYVLYLMEEGLNLAEVGIWLGMNTVAVLILEVPTGGLADAWGRGRTFAAANILISLSLLTMIIAPGKLSLYIGAALFGSGRALSSGSLDAWFIDGLKKADPDVDIEKELGPAGAFTLLMIAAGSLLGSLIPGFFEHSLSPGRWSSFSVPLLLDAAIKILTAVLTLILIREPSRHSSAGHALAASFNTAPELARSVIRNIKAQPSLVLIFAGGAALALGMGSVESFWQPRFAGLSPEGEFGILFGLVMAGCFLAGALSSLAAPHISAFPGGSRARTALFFTLMTAVSLLLLSLFESRLLTACGMMAVYASSEGASVPRKALLNDSIPGSLRATMLSVDSLSFYLGFACVVVLGFLANSAGIPAAWRAAALLILAISWVYPLYTRLSYGTEIAGEEEWKKRSGENGP